MRLSAALFFSALLVACASPESRKVVVEAGPESFAAEYARAVCDSIDGCCATNGWKLDHDSCVIVVQGEKQEEINRAAAAGQRIDYAAGAPCIAAARAAFRSCPTTEWRTASKRLRDACNIWVVPENPKPPGGSCTKRSECSSAGCDDAYCTDADAGHCVCGHLADSLASAGQPCSADGPHVWTCWQAGDRPETELGVAHPPFRGVYYPAPPATWALWCGPGMDGGGVCTPTSPLGAACDPFASTGGINGSVPSCGGADCGANSRMCEPGALAGAPCGPLASGSGAWVRCEPGSYCDYPSWVCVAKVADGDTCRESRGCRGGFCDSFGKRCIASPFAPLYVCGAL